MAWKIPVLKEDDAWMMVDKPPGLPLRADPDDPESYGLIDLLHRDIEQQVRWAMSRNLRRLFCFDQLDADTSGIVVLGKTREARLSLGNQFGGDKPSRQYLVLVHGVPREDEFVVDAKLMKHRHRLGTMRVHGQHGKKSRTSVRVLERFNRFSLLSCAPAPDRWHQVRVHLQHAGHPLVGDSLYRGAPLLLSRIKPNYRFKPGEPERPLIGRAALHVSEIRLQHPKTGEEVCVHSPRPKDFEVALKYLRRFADSSGVSLLAAYDAGC